MSEAAPGAAATAPVATTAPTTPGRRLRAERERRGLNLQKAADEMHLDSWVLEALESDDYRRIGPAVFAKGHLKKYAGILDLPAAELLEGFDARWSGTAAPTEQRGLDVRSDSPLAAPAGMRFAGTLAVIVIAGVAAGLWWWQPWHARVDSSSFSGAVVETPAPVASDTSNEAAGDIARDTSPTPKAVVPIAAEPPLTVAMPIAAQPVVSVRGTGRARLRMSFSSDSRVEIRDAAGKLVFSGVGQANSVKVLSGAGPLHVYLSDAGGVQLEINERAVAISAKFLSGNVAHFDAGADGVLRRDTAAVAEQRPRG